MPSSKDESTRFAVFLTTAPDCKVPAAPTPEGTGWGFSEGAGDILREVEGKLSGA